MVSRRELLITTGAMVGVAGCANLPESGTANDSSLNETDDEAVEPAPQPQDRLELGEVILQATDDEAYDVQLVVEDDSGVVHLDTYTIEANTSRVQVDRVWEDSPAEYRLVLRVNDREKEVVDVADQAATTNTCTDLLVDVDSEDAVSVWNQACTTTE